MPTTTLNAYSSAYPLVVNRIRASIFKQSSPQAIVASIIDTTIGHPLRQYNFVGLPRNNYGFSLDEINAAGVPVQNLALFSVVPSTIDGLLTRNDEQIRCDITTGFVSGTSSFTFDGTAGKPNYVGWDIVPSELTGRGILAKDLDYTWDKLLGIFNLLQAGDVFQNSQYYNIHFEPIQNTAGNSVLSINDFSSKLIVADYAIILDDFSNKLVLDPSGGYLVATLPDIATVVEGRKLMIEGSGEGCSKIAATSGQTIKFHKGNIYILPDESMSIYKFKRSDGVFEWRVYEAYGNYKIVGQMTSDDCLQSQAKGKRLLNGNLVNVLTEARLYNDFVLNLPLDQVVSFSNWGIGSNKYFYSYADASGNFFLPDRRNAFERNNFNGKAGDFFSESIGPHSHTMILGGNGTGASGGTPFTKPAITDNRNQSLGRASTDILDNIGAETRPQNYLTNKYVIL